MQLNADQIALTVTKPDGGTIDLPVLHADAPDFVDKLTEVLGVAEGCDIQIITPQFDRIDDIKPRPPTQETFGALHNMSAEELTALGLGLWETRDDGKSVWLFPGEWFEYIPLNFKVICINGKESEWGVGHKDDDTRFGMLPYGFLR